MLGTTKPRNSVTLYCESDEKRSRESAAPGLALFGRSGKTTTPHSDRKDTYAAALVTHCGMPLRVESLSRRKR
jgi:hypothetical protein